MQSSAEKLTNLETCFRKVFYSREWQKKRLDSTQILYQAIASGLTSDREDFGEAAGEAVMELAEDRGFDTTAPNIYDSAVHHAALADIIVTAVRKGEPWRRPGPTGGGWQPSCFISPAEDRLRRILLVSAWSEDRHYAEIRSWYGHGEVAALELPMTQVVIVLGAQRQGKRHSPWTKGFLHPRNRQLRFRKKGSVVGAGFRDSWETVFREEHAEIDRKVWLQTMLEDDVLRDVMFTVPIDVPPPVEVERLQSMAKTKLDFIAKMAEMPIQNLSTCDYPVRCQFQAPCLGGRDIREGDFVKLERVL